MIETSTSPLPTELRDSLARAIAQVNTVVLGKRREVRLAFVCLLVFAVRAQEDWAALVMGVGLIPVATEISCYYYGILLVFAFLQTSRPWIAPALCVLSALTWLLAGIGIMEDDVYVATSVAVLMFVVALTTQMAFTSSRGFSQRFALPSQISAQL